MMTAAVYVPRDAGALSLGAEAVAQASPHEAAPRGRDVRIVRNGSRGLYWLEPLVEVETSAVRAIAYGPVSARDVPALFDAGFLAGRRACACDSGRPRRSRISPASNGSPSRASASSIRSASTTTWRTTACQGLQRALAHDARGRSSRKSRIPGCAAAAAPRSRPASSGRRCSIRCAPQKYVTCNADEGDSGTFADRMLMEGDPFVADRRHDHRRVSRSARRKATSTCASNIRTRTAR